MRTPTFAGLAAVLVLGSGLTVPAAAAEQPQATIRYTEYGIPHVLAGDFESLGFGQGYAAARDNLCVIADGMLTLGGERSRHFGPDTAPTTILAAARTNLVSDSYFTAINDSRAIEQQLAKPAPLGPKREVREMVRGYAAGFNAYQRERPRSSCRNAGWLRPMTELDVYRRAYALGLLMSQSQVPDTIASANPPAVNAPQPKPATDPAAAARAFVKSTLSGPGSNAIAVGRSATKNGRGISLANPHLPWAGDLLWWQSQLTIPGRYNVAGASFVGTPFVSLGHNETQAWSGTIADAIRHFTLFELKLVPGKPTTYLVDGREERMRKQQVTVKVRQPDGSIQNVTKHQWNTRYGPVVDGMRGMDLPWTSTTAYAFADPNAGNLRMLNSLFEAGRAKDSKDFLRRMRETQGMPIFNLLVADNKGEVAFAATSIVAHVTDEHAARCNTELGRQTFPAAGIAVLDGSRRTCAWGNDADAIQPGTFGPGNLPSQVRTDYVANSNESYWLTNANQPLEGYDRILGGERAIRNIRTRDTITEITDQLGEQPFGKQEMHDLLYSNRSYAAELARDDTVRMCRELPDLAQACDTLQRWDLRWNVESRGALLFGLYWKRLYFRLPDEVLWKVPFDVDDPVNTPHTLNTDAPEVRAALTAAVEQLEQEGIPLSARLGDYQYVRLGDRKVPLGGGAAVQGVFKIVASDWVPGEGYTRIGGLGANSSSYLHIVAFDGDRCPDSSTLLTYSQSADPTSAHDNDQLDLFAKDQWVTERFCEHEIRASPELRAVRLGSKGLTQDQAGDTVQ